MFRILVKLVALSLCAWLAFLFWSSPENPKPNNAWLVAGFVIILGLISFSKKISVGDKEPGLIVRFSVMLLIGPVMFFHMIPALFEDYGIHTQHTANTWSAIAITLFVSAIFAFAVWVPYISYKIIDFIFNRLESQLQSN